MSNHGDALLVWQGKAKAITAYELAERFVGTTEVTGPEHNCRIMSWLHRSMPWVADDKTAHCAAFVHEICYCLGLPMPEVDVMKHTHPARARSWLTVGRAIPITEARSGFDLVIFRRKIGDPGVNVLDALGHVGFYSAYDGGNFVDCLGANQDNTVKVKPYLADNLLGVRRAYG